MSAAVAFSMDVDVNNNEEPQQKKKKGGAGYQTPWSKNIVLAVSMMLWEMKKPW